MTKKLKIVNKFKTERFETMKIMEATTDLWCSFLYLVPQLHVRGADQAVQQ